MLVVISQQSIETPESFCLKSVVWPFKEPTRSYRRPNETLLCHWNYFSRWVVLMNPAHLSGHTTGYCLPWLLSNTPLALSIVWFAVLWRTNCSWLPSSFFTVVIGACVDTWYYTAMRSFIHPVPGLVNQYESNNKWRMSLKIEDLTLSLFNSIWSLLLFSDGLF